MLSNYQKMDINMLLSIVNMKLRNEKQTLEAFCITYQLEQVTLLERFKSHSLIYDATQNQFKKS